MGTFDVCRASADVGIDEAVSRKRFRVLVVDDEERIRQVICELLKDAGLEVIEAASGDEGWTLMQDNADIDLLLTDVRMPGTMNGFDLVAAALAHRPALRTIVMSGYAGESIGRPMQADLFLQKPFTLVSILSKIEHLLFRSQPLPC